MTVPKRRQTLSRRGVVRANAGPLREVKVELGIVLLLVLLAYTASLGLSLPPWQEALGLLGIASAGAGWIVLRTRQAGRRAGRPEAQEVDHGPV